jgi:hypothetical protein
MLNNEEIIVAFMTQRDFIASGIHQGDPVAAGWISEDIHMLDED